MLASRFLSRVSSPSPWSAFGVIHADYILGNVRFLGRQPGAIDFDDCGWGFVLYDLAVTLSELEGRPRYDPRTIKRVRYYADPMNRLVRLHSSFQELSTGLVYQSPFYGFQAFVGYAHSFFYLRGRWRWVGIDEQLR